MSAFEDKADFTFF